ncbi:NAD-binding protein [Rhodobacterales bacterium HKCCE3408]|nr:NAD-binding protein [Rhodobacterales bacterium HKCCE3408]
MDREAGAASGKARLDLDVGWIGAGKMGAPMLRNLLAAGARVSVTEPDADNLASVEAAGAVAASSAADHGSAAIVFSTLPNDDALLSVVEGTPDRPGLAASMARDAIFVEMSTVSPVCSAKIAKILADEGIHYVRAPLSGSTAMAEQATLTVLGSGPETAWQSILPCLEALSARQFYLGSGEEARFMKLVLNTLVGASSAILSEALALGARGGLSAADMMAVICESAVASPLLKYKTDNVVNDDYSPAFSVSQMIKDFTLISDAARAERVPIFTTSLILELYRAAANSGLRDEDFFSLVKWHRTLSAG